MVCFSSQRKPNSQGTQGNGNRSNHRNNLCGAAPGRSLRRSGSGPLPCPGDSFSGGRLRGRGRNRPTRCIGPLFQPKQPQQQRNNSGAVELDIVLFLVVLHGFFDGFSAVIQAALNRALGGALNGRNLLDGQLFKIAHHNGASLLLRQRIDHLPDGIFQVFLVQRLSGDELLPFFHHGIEDGGSILLFIRQQLVALAEISRASVIGDFSAPGCKCLRVLQLADGLNDLNKGILSQIRSQLRVIPVVQGFQYVIVNVIVTAVVQPGNRILTAVLQGFHQLGQFLFFHANNSR